ncbi:MAG: class I SAM-dependent methyltransferase [Planctomycetota bacterium]
MPADVFSDLTDVYDALIDWEKRLKHEEPFYRRWFTEVSARRVLDAACGSGRHAAMFHAWGLEVEGADLSPAMIARARQTFGEPEKLSWAVRAFEVPTAAEESFDAAICVGNSLALAAGLAEVRQALAALALAVRPGGVVLVQVLNFHAITEGPCLWQKCKRLEIERRGLVVVKGVHRTATRGYVDLVVAPLDDPQAMQTESAPLLILDDNQLAAAAADAELRDLQFFGGYRDQPYERTSSTDLVMVARK